MTRRHQLLIGVTAPIRLLDRQVQAFERLLDTPLCPQDLNAVRQACARSGVRLGAYYHWYLQKWVMARCFQRASRASILSRIGEVDRTDYTCVDRIPDDGHGVLVALPHFGHYVLSIIGLINHLKHSREVLVFYGAPATHLGNDLFDRLHGQLFGDARSNTSVIHNTRSGLAQAVRGLEGGAAVIILPDVFRRERDTFLVPFCGRPLNVMLGTASLARRTASRILPAVSLPSKVSLRFKTAFLPMIDSTDARAPRPEDAIRHAESVHADYRTTLALFETYENAIDDQVMYWQYCRSHYGRTLDFPYIAPEEALRMCDLLLADPRVNVANEAPICID